MRSNSDFPHNSAYARKNCLCLFPQANRFDIFCCFGLRSSTDHSQIAGHENNSMDSSRPVGEVDSLSLSSSALDDVQLSAPLENDGIPSESNILCFKSVEMIALVHTEA